LLFLSSLQNLAWRTILKAPVLVAHVPLPCNFPQVLACRVCNSPGSSLAMRSSFIDAPPEVFSCSPLSTFSASSFFHRNRLSRRTYTGFVIGRPWLLSYRVCFPDLSLMQSHLFFLAFSCFPLWSSPGPHRPKIRSV